MAVWTVYHCTTCPFECMGDPQDTSSATQASLEMEDHCESNPGHFVTVGWRHVSGEE